MKLISCFSFLLLTLVNPYDKVLTGLEKNFVLLLDEMGEEAFYEYYEIDSIESSRLYSEYERALNEFYNSDYGLVEYLLSYENTHQEICPWIKTVNPFKSEIVGYDLISKSKGALILIDNFLLAHDKGRITIHRHIENLTYMEVKTFCMENKQLTISELRKEYSSFVERFGYSP